MDVVGRVGNSRNEFRAMDRHEHGPWVSGRSRATYLPSTRIYLRAATPPISAPPKNWQFACKFRAMFRPLSTPAATSYPPPSVLPSERSSRNDRVYFDFSSNRPPTRLPITFSFSNSQFIGPRTATNFPFALHPSSRNIFRLTFSHYFHSTVSSCSLLFSIAKCLDTLVIRNP